VVPTESTSDWISRSSAGDSWSCRMWSRRGKVAKYRSVLTGSWLPLLHTRCPICNRHFERGLRLHRSLTYLDSMLFGFDDYSIALCVYIWRLIYDRANAYRLTITHECLRAIHFVICIFYSNSIRRYDIVSFNGSKNACNFSGSACAVSAESPNASSRLNPCLILSYSLHG